MHYCLCETIHLPCYGHSTCLALLLALLLPLVLPILLVQEASQEDFFERSGAKALIDNLLAGLNVSLFCYGQVRAVSSRGQKGCCISGPCTLVCF